MNDINGISRSENDEYAEIIDASGACGAVVDLEPYAEDISTQVCHTNRHVVHLCTAERRARARGIGDGESVLREGVQDSTGIIEELEGLVTSVDDGRCDRQVLRSVAIEGGDRGLDGQARCREDHDRAYREDGEGSTEGGREHYEGTEGGWSNGGSDAGDSRMSLI